MSTDQIRVFLVEDDWAWIGMVREALAADPTYQFLGHLPSRAALDEFLAAHQPDLAIVDLGLSRPGAGLDVGLERFSEAEGLPVIDQISVRCSETVVVALSGYFLSHPYLVWEVMNRGAVPIVKQEGPVGPEWGHWLRGQLHAAYYEYWRPSPAIERLRYGLEAARPAEALPLTPRQLEVARLYADGCSVAQIAACLCIDEDTVRGHIAKIHGRLQVRYSWQMTARIKHHWQEVQEATRRLDGQCPPPP